MGRLNHAIAALDVLGPLMQAVPVIGDGLKSATEITSLICQTVENMKENREGYEQLADRTARLLAAVASAITKADPQQLSGLEKNIARWVLTLQEIKLTTETRLHVPASPTRKLHFIMWVFRTKIKNALRVSNDRKEINALEKKLDRVIEEFGIASSLRVELGVDDARALAVRLSKHIEDMNHNISRGFEEMNVQISRTTMSVTLSTLHPIHSARWDEVNINPCMEDTRIQLLADIMSWAEAPDTSLVFWLNGLAGTGKSTIARTICDRLESRGLLGASFFFSRQVADRRNAAGALRTIAYQLAKQHPALSKAIATTLQDSPELSFSEGVQKLITELLIKPGTLLAADAGLVIVIDALDECTEDGIGHPGGDLLPLLLRGLLQLSGRVKLFLTSRAEPEIRRLFDLAALGSQQRIVQLHDLDGSVVRSDIKSYLTRAFENIAKKRPDLDLLNWPLQEDIDVIVNLADVLFVFAATVMRFVDTPRRNPRARLKTILTRHQGDYASPYHFLDQLYLDVLNASVRSEQQEDEALLCTTFRTVVGSVVVAQQPLPVKVHAILLDIDRDDVGLMIASLSSLLLGTSNEPVRIFHPSFLDFIVAQRRCGNPRFLISLDEHHLRLALGCFALLNQHLRYNMANLDDPDVANGDVKDLDARLCRGICDGGNHIGSSLPQALFYGARYWSAHVLATSAMNSELLDALGQFCNDHLFHWLELLSLIQGLTYTIQPKLLAVIQWCEAFDDDIRAVKIKDLLRDTVRLLQVYAQPIRSHALHVIHSASVTMPFCPLLDTLARGNAPRVRHSLISPRAAHWSSSGPILEAESDVKGVAISPNGQLVVAGMKSGRLRVWSTVDFEEVALLAGHKDSIGSVAISSDGLRIASGSRDRTIRVWDGLTFEELGLCEDAGDVYSVAFSPDNSLIASGSPDCAVRIWDALSFAEVTRLAGHKDVVTSIVFFPDGTRIASASSDCTVRMWNARTYEPLPGIQCSGEVCVIAISPDSVRLAVREDSSGGVGILRVFDAVTLTEQAQVQTYPGHLMSQSIGFSPDGDSIASGTGSGAVQVWDANTLSMLSTSRGHHGQVTAIVFSADGSRIISGSLDGTVHIRPVKPLEEQFVPIPGHDEWVCQAVFSPDHSRVVSGSSDNTVRIWDGLTCEELAVLTGHDHVIWTVAYSPDGSRVLSGSEDCSIRIWSALDFQEITVLKGHRGGVMFVTFAPDATLIASCSGDYTVRLWSSFTFQELACLEGHRDIVWSVAFSSQGTRVVSVSDDKTVRVWDAVSFTQLAELDLVAHSQDIRSFLAFFSLDDKAILTRLWDDGPAWVCSNESFSAWTAGPFSEIIATHPRHVQPRVWSDGWVHCATESGHSRIWLPAERRVRARSVAAAGSRIVTGGSGGTMSIIALSS